MSQNNNETYAALSEPFPQEMEKRLNKGGASLTYIPVSEVINRMNKVLGVDGWSFTVKTWEQLGTSIVAHVTVNATINGSVVTREGVGGQKIKISKQGDPVDIGDEVKGAVSDALKKAVQTLGVGLYLARSEDAIEIEQVMDAEAIAPQPKLQSGVTAERWAAFMDISKKLTAVQKEEIKNLWSEYSDGQPTPSATSVTEEDLDFLTAEVVRIQFGGTKVN